VGVKGSKKTGKTLKRLGEEAAGMRTSFLLGAQKGKPFCTLLPSPSRLPEGGGRSKKGEENFAPASQIVKNPSGNKKGVRMKRSPFPHRRSGEKDKERGNQGAIN